MTSSEFSDAHRPIKVVLDTSVLVAASLQHGLAYDIVSRAVEGTTIQLILSKPLLDEFTRVITEKNTFSPIEVTSLRTTLVSNATFVEPLRVSVVSEDPTDDMIIGTALAGEAIIIVSLDKHLLKLKRHKTIAIVHPRTFTWILPSS